MKFLSQLHAIGRVWPQNSLSLAGFSGSGVQLLDVDQMALVLEVGFKSSLAIHLQQHYLKISPNYGTSFEFQLTQ
jgi:hypothetical protein